MPTYNVKNLRRERKRIPYDNERILSVEKDNPDWDKDWSSVAGTTYGQPKQSDGFKEVMTKVQKAHPRQT